MPDSLETDILIIGGGPAGATLARALPGHLKVLVADGRPDNPPFPHKPCGGLLAPDAQACLFHMGLAMPREVMVSRQPFGVRVVDFKTGRERCFQRHYLNMNRERFDRWLLSLALEKENVSYLKKKFHTFRQHPDHVSVSLSGGGTVRCKFLVGADGASSGVAWRLKREGREAGNASSMNRNSLADGRPFFSLRKALFSPRRYLAMQEWFTVKDSPAEFGAYFHPAITDYYSWSIPKDNLLLIGAALPWPGEDGRGSGVKKGDAKHRFEFLKNELVKRGFDLSRSEHKESCAILKPAPLQPFSPGEGRVALVGEAACLISPSSAEGLSFAMRSAMSLAKAFHGACPLRPPTSPHAESADDGSKYGSRLLSKYLDYLAPLERSLRLKAVKANGIYNPLLRNIALCTGVGSFSQTGFW